jgi:hypothetical protein
MLVLRWLADYWYVPFLAIGAIIGAIFLIRAKPATREAWAKVLGSELAAIKAKREVRDLRIQLGEERAKQYVLIKYAEKRKNLTKEAKTRIKSLEDKPEELAKVLERLTR